MHKIIVTNIKVFIIKALQKNVVLFYSHEKNKTYSCKGEIYTKLQKGNRHVPIISLGH